MKFTLALCQMGEAEEKEAGYLKAEKMIKMAKEAGAQIVALPEMWCCPYSGDYFRSYSEGEDGRTVAFMREMAASKDIYLVGGSIPERDNNKVYNTSFIFDRSGNIIGRHRKAHLFDIDVEGGIKFMESETLTAGDKVTVVDTEYGKMGVAICYDVRFPEMIRKMTLDGAEWVVLPGAFNMTTGPMHWTMTMRARALDNQIYFAAVSPARVEDAAYTSYGHSVVVDPWGALVIQAGEGEDVVVADIDTEYVKSIRRQLPLLQHRREDLYSGNVKG